jgi:hypothetical protein
MESRPHGDFGYRKRDCGFTRAELLPDAQRQNLAVEPREAAEPSQDVAHRCLIIEASAELVGKVRLVAGPIDTGQSRGIAAL